MVRAYAGRIHQSSPVRPKALIWKHPDLIGCSLSALMVDIFCLSILGILKMAGIVTWRYAYRIVSMQITHGPSEFWTSGTETRVAQFSLGKYPWSLCSWINLHITWVEYKWSLDFRYVKLLHLIWAVETTIVLYLYCRSMHDGVNIYIYMYTFKYTTS